MCVQERWLLQPVGEAVKFPQQKTVLLRTKTKAAVGMGNVL